MKTCALCGFEKPLTEFNKSAKSRDGKSSYCCDCAHKKLAAWRANNVEHRSEYRRKYNHEHVEQNTQQKRSWRNRNRKKVYQLGKDFNQKNYERTLWYDAKRRAATRGTSFNIDHTDIVIPDYCPVFGVKLVRGVGKLTDSSPTVDCLIPERGYVKGNVAVVCHRANRLKSNATSAELRRIADWIDRKLVGAPVASVEPIKGWPATPNSGADWIDRMTQ